MVGANRAKAPSPACQGNSFVTHMVSASSIFTPVKRLEVKEMLGNSFVTHMVSASSIFAPVKRLEVKEISGNSFVAHMVSNSSVFAPVKHLAVKGTSGNSFVVHQVSTASTAINKRPLTVNQPLFSGDLVTATFLGGSQLAGEILRPNCDGSYDVLFSNGAKEVRISRKHIGLTDRPQKGTKLKQMSRPFSGNAFAAHLVSSAAPLVPLQQLNATTGQGFVAHQVSAASVLVRVKELEIEEPKADE